MYAILNRHDRSALLAHQAYHVYRRALDLEAMRAAAQALIGEHDFRSFCGTLPEGGMTIRTVRSLEIERFGDLVRVKISADGFLHRMVRTIVGTLVECGLGTSRSGDDRIGARIARPHGSRPDRARARAIFGRRAL